MDSSNDEQTELLRDIWKQMVAMDRNLSSRIDQTNVRLETIATRMQENFGRIHRNFERVDARLERLADRARVEDLDSRLTRVEEHVGLRSR